MARLFTAVELAPDARARIAAHQTEVARRLVESGDHGLRLVRPAQLHLTLVFMGEVDEARLPSIATVMHHDIPMPPFEIEFGSSGVFPPAGAARVLWLGVDRGAQELTTLFDLVSQRLETLGVEREPRPFAPHLTLGRWRDGGGRRVRGVLTDVGSVAVDRVGEVVLFRSRLLSGGAEHAALARARLAGASAALH